MRNQFALFSLLVSLSAFAVGRSHSRKPASEALTFSAEGQTVREHLRKHLRLTSPEWSGALVDVEWTPLHGLYKSSVRLTGPSRGPASDVYYLVNSKGQVADFRPDDDLNKFLLNWNKISADSRPKLKSEKDLFTYLQDVFQIYTLSPTAFACQSFSGKGSVICKMKISYIGSTNEESLRISPTGAVYVLR